MEEALFTGEYCEGVLLLKQSNYQHLEAPKPLNFKCEDEEFVHSVKDLTICNIVHKSIGNITLFSNISKLTLKQCYYLEDIKPIFSLHKLESLSIESSGLKDFEIPLDAPRIIELKISDSPIVAMPHFNILLNLKILTFHADYRFTFNIVEVAQNCFNIFNTSNSSINLLLKTNKGPVVTIVRNGEAQERKNIHDIISLLRQ
jgi:hypothetical protein